MTPRLASYFRTLVCTGALALSASVASAALLTFDGVSSAIAPLGSPLTYSEDGFIFTFSTCTSCTTHYGDGTINTATLNWHDGGANPIGMSVTLTRDDGGLLDLLGFDALVFDPLGFGGTTANGVSFSTGAFSQDFLGVNSVVFLTAGTVQLDNVEVRNGGTVPEPGSIALLGLGLAGLASTRRRKQ